MSRTLFSLLLVALLGSKATFAQSDKAFDEFFTFGWDVNIPMGDKFVDATSYAGGKMEFRKMVKHNLSIGLDLSWNSYYEYQPYQTYRVNESTDITTDLYRYNYTLPMAITGHYYFDTNSRIFQPYAGLGLGAVYAEQKLYVNIYELSGDNWGFLARPEIGTIIRFHQDSDMGLLLGARYSYSTNSNDSFKIDNLQALGFNLGFVWTY